MIKLLLEMHMAKGHNEKENAVDKVEINISSDRPQTVSPIKTINVIDAEVINK